MHPLQISGVAVADLYVCANLLLGATAAFFAVIRASSAKLSQPLAYRHLLIIGRVVVVAALLLSVITSSSGGSDLSPISTQIWSAPSMQTQAAILPDAARMEIGLASQHAIVPLNTIEDIALLFFAIGLLFTLLPLLPEASITWRAIRDSHPVRRIGHVRILISEQKQVPFAVWVPGRAWIVLPGNLLMSPTDLRLALRHEAQHHRQGDTRCLYAVLLLRALFGLNPAVHWLARQLSELGEYSCDEALAMRQGHCARTYCTCLLRIADAARSARNPSLRSCMARERPFALAKRIEVALNRPVQTLRGRAALPVVMLFIALLATLSSVIGGPIRDRRISRAEAMHLAATVRGYSAIPLNANRTVVAQLNLLLGTPNGRAYLHSSFMHMRAYKPEIVAALRRDDLPNELTVIPVVESGYRNVSESGEPGAGLWQMIAPTAQHYGLVVNGNEDERLNVVRETAAATRMLAELYGRFHNWALTVMAYNAGAKRIEAGIHATHSHDAWTLYRAGFGNDPNYLARTVAAILILDHPRLLH